MKNYPLFLITSVIFIACSNSNSTTANKKEDETKSKDENIQSDIKEPVNPYYLTFTIDGKQELSDLKESDLNYNYSLSYENSTGKKELTTKFKVNKDKVINFSLFLPGELPQDITTLKGDTCLFEFKNITTGFDDKGISNNTVTLATNFINDNKPVAIIDQVDHLGKKNTITEITDWYLLKGRFEGNLGDKTGTIKKLENGKFAVVIRK